MVESVGLGQARGIEGFGSLLELDEGLAGAFGSGGRVVRPTAVVFLAPNRGGEFGALAEEELEVVLVEAIELWADVLGVKRKGCDDEQQEEAHSVRLADRGGQEPVEQVSEF